MDQSPQESEFLQRTESQQVVIDNPPDLQDE